MLQHTHSRLHVYFLLLLFIFFLLALRSPQVDCIFQALNYRHIRKQSVHQQLLHASHVRFWLISCISHNPLHTHTNTHTDTFTKSSRSWLPADQESLTCIKCTHAFIKPDIAGQFHGTATACKPGQRHVCALFFFSFSLLASGCPAATFTVCRCGR